MSKPMSTKKFLKKKNKIIFKVTGKILVPKDQITDTERIELIVSESACYELNASICPYCKIFIDEQGFSDCERCPMSLAGNQCVSDDETDTWAIAREIWKEKASRKDIFELYALCAIYNKE